jgi:hypothetical protein
MLFAAATSLAAITTGDAMILTDFSNEAPDMGWRVVNDNVMGGRSEGGFEFDGERLIFRGATNTNGGGFASIRSTPRPLALQDYRSIELRVRGDGRTYTFRLETMERVAYWADFSTRAGGGWQTVQIPFAQFRPRRRGQWLPGPPLDVSRVDSLGIMIYDERDGPFRLEVDRIGVTRLAQAAA